MIDLREMLDRFASKKVLLIGDTILDIYTYGAAMGLSAETPTIVARRKEMKYSLGGAALVCRNLLELGAEVQFVTLVGDDDEARYVRNFAHPRLIMRAVIDPDRPSTVKHRFWVDGYKLFQLDQREDGPVSDETGHQVIKECEGALPDIGIVVISDYRHGLLSERVIGDLLSRLRPTGIPVYVDSQVSQNSSNHLLYRGNCVICLNLREARCIDPKFTPAVDPATFKELNRLLDTERIVVKLGAEGAIFQDGVRVVQVVGNKVTAVDTTGAGDAFLSAFCLAGFDNPDGALRLANTWAALSIQIHGTVPPQRDDLLRALEEV